MDSNSPRVSISESAARPPATIQRQPPFQEQSETQTQFVSSIGLYDNIPPSTDNVLNEPALWQLGRHSYYMTRNGYDQQSATFSGQPVVGFTEGDGYGGGLRYAANKVDEAGLHDVEEELYRGFQVRQISMMIIGGTIGTNLVIGAGTTLKLGGPLGILLGYSFVACICYCLVQSIGEMATYLPHKKGLAGYASRFWHPAFGFAVGWTYFFFLAVGCPNLVSAVGIMIQYWDTEGRLPGPAWMSMSIVFIFCGNLLGIRVFGELEFWLSSIKMITLIGLIIFGIIIDLGGNPQGDRIGFRYWREPGPMGKYLEETVGDGPLATFLGFWSVMANAMSSYVGIELIGVVVGEAENPRHSVPKAIRRTFFRITFFYISGVFVIGLIMPSDAPVLGEGGMAASPFVYVAQELRIRGLGHVINASMLIFIISLATTTLYTASRTLYGLGLLGQAPKIFRRVTKRGVPVWALLFPWLFSFLVFMNLGAQDALTYLVNASVTTGGITWICIFYTHIRFMKGLAAQGLSRDDIPYKAQFQPWASWFGIIATGMIVVFAGYDTFIYERGQRFKAAGFVSTYIAFPIFFLFAAFWKWKEGDETVPYSKLDLVTGKQELDYEERAFLEAQRLLGPC